jgi:hypothetical protein
VRGAELRRLEKFRQDSGHFYLSAGTSMLTLTTWLQERGAIIVHIYQAVHRESMDSKQG